MTDGRFSVDEIIEGQKRIAALGIPFDLTQVKQASSTLDEIIGSLPPHRDTPEERFAMWIGPKRRAVMLWLADRFEAAERWARWKA